MRKLGATGVLLAFLGFLFLQCHSRFLNKSGVKQETERNKSQEPNPAPSSSTSHPLDDLSVDELAVAVAVTKESSEWTPASRLVVVNRYEPPKAQVLTNPSAIGRHALVVLYDLATRKLSELRVDLANRRIADKKDIPNVQPSIMLDEYEHLIQIVKSDPQWQQAMRRRGLNNFDEIAVDSWAPGLLSDSEKRAGVRILRGLSYFKGASSNYYARPIEGVVAVVDMTNEKVIELIDDELVPIAAGKQEFSAEANKPLRKALEPLRTEMPNGRSFVVNGQQVNWQNWSFRFSFEPMKGLVLYQIGYEDQGRVRSIAYKISLSEMMVPYSAAPRTWSFRNAFDVGEYGIGRTAHSLDPLIDVPPYAAFFDANFANEGGELINKKRVVAIYERDGGLMWKHNDVYVGNSQGRRARQLVATFMTTVGNYDYGISYIFHQDGAIEIESQLTGVLLAKGSELEENPCLSECTQMVEKNIIAPPHQHFFAFRLDLDIDGTANTPYQMTVEALPPGAENPDGNAFKAINRPITNEAQAAGQIDMLLQRKWKVANTTVKNELGHPTGYKIMPGINSLPYLQENSSVRRRGGFINRHMWFTQYHDNEQSAAGDYPNQADEGKGLPEWTNGEALDNQDVVAWYVFGITHIPRPEEWPVMNVERGGFHLAPVNFFSRNPVLNLPSVDQASVDEAISRIAR